MIFLNIMRMALLSLCIVRLCSRARMPDEVWAWSGDGWTNWLVPATIFAYHYTDTTAATRWMAYIAGGYAAVDFWYLPPPTQGMVVWCGGLWGLYLLLLRQNTLLKPVLVALVWTISTYGVYNGLQTNPAAWAGTAERFCFILALALGYDLADQRYDTQHQTATIPLAFGAYTAWKLAAGALLLAAVCEGYQVMGLSRRVDGFRWITYAVAVVLLYVLSHAPPPRTRKAVYWWKMAVDAVMLG
jgi:4-hydroxybenzoate polyprenyltransferase